MKSLRRAAGIFHLRGPDLSEMDKIFRKIKHFEYLWETARQKKPFI